MEYEQVQTLATVRGLGRVGWDALGQFLLVEAEVMRKDGQLFRFPISLLPEAAEELHARLGAALAEKGREEPNRQ